MPTRHDARAANDAHRPAASPRPLRDNPVLILFWIALLLGGLAAMLTLANRSTELSPDFLSEVVLWALSAIDVSIVLVLLFVLARNVVKLVVERRRGLPFARFRSKLVGALLLMTFIPALLVLFVGSELLRNSANRWFSTPIDEVLTSAREIASNYYQQRLTDVAAQADLLANELAAVQLSPANGGVVRDRAWAFVRDGRLSSVQVYRLVPAQGATTSSLDPLVDVALPRLTTQSSRGVADRLAAQAFTDGTDTRVAEPLDDGGQMMRAASVVRSEDGRAVGVVVASDYQASDLARHSRRIVDAYEAYQQLRVLKRPLEGVYLSFFLMITLLILVSATWTGLYVAKRITRPIHRLALAAREIGAGHFDHRVEPETRDEFGSLVEAFNTMADALAVSQRRLDRSRQDLERQNLQAEARRRYIETVLERVATGVISLDANRRVETINGAAQRLLRLGAPVVGQPVGEALSREDLEPVATFVSRALRHRRQSLAQEVALGIDGDEVHLAVAVTSFEGEDGSGGTVIVLDDVTPLIRAQKVAAWRDVARRLAHEVKNPLTPIQLSAERLLKHFAASPEPARRLVDECATTIKSEVDSLKLLVEEFSQFARMPAPRTVPSDLNALLEDTIQTYGPTFKQVRFERRFAPSLPQVRVDPEQFRRVITNLIANADEALADYASSGQGVITIESQHERGNGIVRIVVADNGPGIPEGDRGKLFLPYYSTKRRGSGLGLAIVRRIIVEHGGNIEATDNEPHGTRMTIELPVEQASADRETGEEVYTKA